MSPFASRILGYVAAVLAGVSLARAQPAATFQYIDSAPGYTPTSGGLVSADGRVVIGAINPVGSVSEPSARLFRWTAGQGTEVLPVSPAWRLWVSGISADGTVVVGATYDTSVQQDGRPFRWTATGGYQILSQLPGTWASGVSADGNVVVGRTKSGADTHAFRWTPSGGMQDLGTMLPSHRYSVASGINAAGTIIVGTSGPSSFDALAFKWTAASGFTAMGQYLSPNYYTNPVAMTPDGSVLVGFSVANYAAYRPMMWLQPQQLGIVVSPPNRGPNDNYVTFTSITTDGSMVLGTSYYGGWLYSEKWGSVDLRRVMEIQGVPIPPTDTINGAAIMTPDGGTIVGSGWHDTGLGYLESRGWIATLDTQSCILTAPDAASRLACAWKRTYVRAIAIASPTAQYRWRRNGQIIAGDATHLGTETSQLQLSRPMQADMGVYDCVITQMCGSVTTPPTTLIWQPCRADQDCSGDVSVQDIFSYLSSFFSSEPFPADVSGDGVVTLQDLFDYLGHYFAAC